MGSQVITDKDRCIPGCLLVSTCYPQVSGAVNNPYPSLTALQKQFKRCLRMITKFLSSDSRTPGQVHDLVECYCPLT